VSLDQIIPSTFSGTISAVPRASRRQFAGSEGNWIRASPSIR